MNLIYSPINAKIDLSGHQFFSLIIENATMFYRLGQDLYNQYNGLEGEAVISEKDDLMIDKNTIFIYDYFDINNNVSKLTNLINKTLETELNHGDYISDLNKINQEIKTLNEKLLRETDLPIDYNKEFTPERFVKLAGFMAKESSRLCENILTHIELVSKIKKVKIIIMINPFIYLSEEAIKAILHDLEFQDAKVLLVNSSEKYLLQGVPKLIVDEDLCVF